VEALDAAVERIEHAPGSAAVIMHIRSHDADHRGKA